MGVALCDDGLIPGFLRPVDPVTVGAMTPDEALEDIEISLESGDRPWTASRAQGGAAGHPHVGIEER